MVLVTGASGLVGSHLITQLLNNEKTVRGIYRSNIPSFSGADKVEWFRGDILDVIALEEAMVGVEQVYHCAAEEIGRAHV